MKKKLLGWTLSAFVVLMLVGFKPKPVLSSFKISGNITGDFDDHFVYLRYNDIIDSVKIVDHKFEFTGMTQDTVVGSIGLKSAYNAPQFYLENSMIQVSLSTDNVVKDGKTLRTIHLDSLKGSHSAEIQEEYKIFYQRNAKNKDFNKILNTKLTSFISKHKSHPFSGAILYELALYSHVLSKQQLNYLYSELDLTKQNPEDLKQFKKGIAALETYGAGKPFPDFSLPDTQEKVINFKNYRGKIVLIDFWASWCGPCRKKNPELVALQKEFGTAKFEIIGISQDKNKKQWFAAIEKDKLPWANLLDVNFKVANELGIQNIPYNYLVDQNGVIIGVNLEISELKEILLKTI